MNLRDQLTSIQNQLTQERSKSAVDKSLTLISQLEEQEADLLQQIAVEDQNQAAQLRIQDATEQAAYFLDNLVIEGFTMRELCVDEPQYQILRIAVQNKLISLAEEHIKNISDVQADENSQRMAILAQLNAANKKIEDNERQFKSDLHQANLERDDFESKLKNATAEIDRLNSQVDDLRKEIAVGARNAYKVTDAEQSQQIKQFAEQIKAARVKVYDVTPDSAINPRNYTATRADNGEPVTYNWTQAKNYIEIKDPNEVEQFRQQFANKEVVSDSALGNEEVVNVAPEEVFPELPSAIAPEVPTIPAPVAEGSSSDNGQGGITKEEFENRIRQVKEEIKAEIVSQFGLVRAAS